MGTGHRSKSSARHERAVAPAKSSEAAAQPRGVRMPVRTCVGCRSKDAPETMARLVAGPGGQVAVDVRHARDGRGAWVHTTRKCIEQMVKRRAAERSLGVGAEAVVQEPGKVVADVALALTRRVGSLLLSGRRGGLVVVGAEAVDEALKARSVTLVVAASDAGATSRALGEPEEGQSTTVRRVVWATRDELGKVFGRQEVAVVAVSQAGLAAEVVATIERLAGLEG